MVVSIDLKALSDEEIAEMKYDAHELWLVQIGPITFGPYETESLKHYVHDNQHLFEHALAARSDEEDWQPFWEYTGFDQTVPEVPEEIEDINKGHFWLMESGIKIGPLSFNEIDKKLVTKHLALTDRISLNDGLSWRKLYEIPEFAARSRTAEELPQTPNEVSFRKAKLIVMEKMAQHVTAKDQLAELAWQGQQQKQGTRLNLEELTIKREKTPEVSKSVKSFVPTAAVGLLAVVTLGYFMVSPEQKMDVTDTQEETPSRQNIPTAPVMPRVEPRGVMPAVAPRAPASVGYTAPARPMRAQTEQASRYPTHMETHDQYQDSMPERDPAEGPVTDLPEPQEHSLVNSQPLEDDQPLDAAMNGVPQPVEPIIEEAADF